MYTTKENKDWGAIAEQLAADYLTAAGYAIMERNFRPKPKLEIDIIAAKDNLVVFVEVKARKNSQEDAVDAVDAKKIRRIVMASDIFLRNIKYPVSARFDIIAISGNADNYELQHLESAFIPPLFSK